MSVRVSVGRRGRRETRPHSRTAILRRARDAFRVLFRSSEKGRKQPITNPMKQQKIKDAS